MKVCRLCALLMLSASCWAHSVALTCTPGDANATSFNFYRSFVPGGPYLFIGSSASCSYNDPTVARWGTMYYYVATGVNANGESAYSNESSANVPPTPTAGKAGIMMKRGELKWR